MEPFVNLSGQPIHPLTKAVFVFEANIGGSSRSPNTLSAGRHVEDGESSWRASIYIPSWNIPLRCRVDTLEWCRELMVHLAPPATQEESNALTNETVRKLVTARVDLEHHAKLYTNAINRFRAVKEDHAGCRQKNTNLREGEELPSHEYKKSLSEPFNMAIQAGWGKGLSKRHTNEEIIAVLRTVEGFDPYSDKKLYPMYNKLFEKEYPYIEKIASDYHHSVADLLMVHPDHVLPEDTSNPNIFRLPVSLVLLLQRELSFA
nr:hypothetical protein [Tanacetum cinerariifolium]